MGRPKGSPNKQKEGEEILDEINGNVVETLKETAEVKTSTTVDSTRQDKAYSIAFNKKLNKWCAVEIIYDLENGTFGGLKVVETNTNKYIVTERFQVLVGQNLL